MSFPPGCSFLTALVMCDFLIESSHAMILTPVEVKNALAQSYFTTPIYWFHVRFVMLLLAPLEHPIAKLYTRGIRGHWVAEIRPGIQSLVRVLDAYV